MRSLDDSDIRNYINLLNKIERTFPSKFIEENEYLKIIRLKEKVLKEYVFSNKKLKFIGFALSFFPILVFKYFLNTIFVICLPGSYPKLSEKKIDYLFFSHFTKSNPKNGSDRIFGKLLDSKNL